MSNQISELFVDVTEEQQQLVAGGADNKISDFGKATFDKTADAFKLKTGAFATEGGAGFVQDVAIIEVDTKTLAEFQKDFDF